MSQSQQLWFILIMFLQSYNWSKSSESRIYLDRSIVIINVIFTLYIYLRTILSFLPTVISRIPGHVSDSPDKANFYSGRKTFENFEIFQRQEKFSSVWLQKFNKKNNCFFGLKSAMFFNSGNLETPTWDRHLHSFIFYIFSLN